MARHKGGRRGHRRSHWVKLDLADAGAAERLARQQREAAAKLESASRLQARIEGAPAARRALEDAERMAELFVPALPRTCASAADLAQLVVAALQNAGQQRMHAEAPPGRGAGRGAGAGRGGGAGRGRGRGRGHGQGQGLSSAGQELNSAGQGLNSAGRGRGQETAGGNFLAQHPPPSTSKPASAATAIDPEDACSPLVRCEVQPNRRKINAPDTGILLLKSSALARRLCELSPLRTPAGELIHVCPNKRNTGIAGQGASWRCRLDPGAARFPIGMLQVGEKTITTDPYYGGGATAGEQHPVNAGSGGGRSGGGGDTFKCFWASSYIYDLRGDCHVEINPVTRVVAVTLGRLQPVKRADVAARAFVEDPAMLRVEIPFPAIVAEVSAECIGPNDQNIAFSFAVKQPPFLFRADTVTGGNSGRIWYPGIGEAPDVRWTRTVDFTPTSAFGRCSVLRVVMVTGSHVFSFQDILHRMALLEKPRPSLEYVNFRSEQTNELPKLNRSFQQAYMLYRIPFSVRYYVNCLVATRLIQFQGLQDRFWQLLYRLPESKAMDLLSLIRNEAEASERTIHDPLSALKEALSHPSTENNLDDDVPGRVADTDSAEEEKASEMKALISAFEAKTSLSRIRAVSESLVGPNSVPAAESESEQAWIRRILITPTRIIPLPPELDLRNRVLRHFSKWKDNFLRISFADEDGNLVSYTASEDIFLRMQQLLEDGVFAAGERFVFLAYSNSQLRDHGCWLYSESDRVGFPGPPTAHEIRKWMGDFSRIRIPGKYAARMGQVFSSTVGTVTISDVQRDTIEDVPDENFEYIFSDGCGIISSKAARRVAKKLHLRGRSATPSAFQVRFGGAKGMLTVWDEYVPPGVEVAVRQSMVKFTSDHGMLEIVGYSKRLPACLNRQIIVLLSGLGVRNEAFLDLQRKVLELLDEAMTSYGALAALNLLYTSGCGSGDVKLKSLSPMMDAAAMFRCGLNATNCQHLFNLMTAFRRRALMDLSTRARIPVEKGVCLIGVMDESGLLPEGNIFVQYTDPSSGAVRAVKGPVVVGRSPCLYPGDIQRAVAYYHPRLKHLVNVVVFPKNGKRPLPSMLSGGDLDGDIFFVFWDPSLLPRMSYPAMNYTADPPQPLDRDVTMTDVIDHFILYVRNDRLGQIASAHQAHADLKGIYAPECLTLASLHSTAVDFAKTGVPADFPRELRPQQFPDFMGKNRKISYRSEKVLGKLFHECQGSGSPHWDNVEFETHGSNDTLNNILCMDPVVTAEFKDEAERVCLEYNLNLMRIMQGLGVETEGEACSGQVSSFSTNHAQVRGRREYFALVQKLNRHMVDLRNRYRDIFWDGLELTSRNVLNPRALFKACAWYQACTVQAQKDMAEGEVPKLSFPWVVTDVLAAIIRHELGQ